eukprot:jgi/Mesvir1/18456/Mv14311-RA.1
MMRLDNGAINYGGDPVNPAMMLQPSFTFQYGQNVGLGTHVLVFRAYDATATLLDTLHFQFKVVAAPLTNILTTPASASDRFGSFTFAANVISDTYGDVGFMCEVAGVTAGFVSCGTCAVGVNPCTGSYAMDMTGQPDGLYTFTVYTIHTFKSGGVVSDLVPVSFGFTLDTRVWIWLVGISTNPAYIWDSNFQVRVRTAIEETQATFSMTTETPGPDFYFKYVVNGGPAARHGNSLTPAGTFEHISLNALSDGVYDIVFTAYNSNDDPGTRTVGFNFKVDTQPPETHILTTPASDRIGSFTFSTDEVSDLYGNVGFMCSLSGITLGFVPCSTCGFGMNPCTGSYSMDLTAQPDGLYTFSVYAINTFMSGVVQADSTPATYSFTLVPATCFDFKVDTQPPETRILTTPAKIMGDRFGKFTFSSDEVSDSYGDIGFLCSVSGVTNGFVPCGTCNLGVEPCIGNYTMDLSGQKDGPYTFRVYSTNTFKSGVVQSDPTPIAYSFTLDTTPPKVVVTKSPAPRSSNAKASFSFYCKDKHACTFWCKLDGLTIDGLGQKSWSLCSSPTVLTVTPKTHVFEVIAKDVAENTSPDWDVFNFYVDTTAPRANFISNSTLRALYIEHDPLESNWEQPTGKYGIVNYPSNVLLNNVSTTGVPLVTNSPNAMLVFNCSHPRQT